MTCNKHLSLLYFCLYHSLLCSPSPTAHNAGSEGVRPTGTWVRKIDKNPKWIIYHSYHLTTHTSGMQRAGAYKEDKRVLYSVNLILVWNQLYKTLKNYKRRYKTIIGILRIPYFVLSKAILYQINVTYFHKYHISLISNINYFGC